MKYVIVKNKFDKKGLILVVILMMLFYFSQQIDNPNIKAKGMPIPAFFFQIVIYFFLANISFKILQALFGSTLFKITGQYLIIEKKCFIKYSKKQYQLDKISNITLNKDARSDVYWGFQGVRFHQKKTAISFISDKKHVITGVDISDAKFIELKKNIIA